MRNQCSIPDCTSLVHGRGWCDMHYRRWEANGDPLISKYNRPKGATAEARFWALVDPCRTDGCALWLGKLNDGGYGRFTLNGKRIRAHHFLVGEPPVGLVWDHVKERGCTHRNCIWPDHLEAVTSVENIQRGENHWRNRTHCSKGHPYNEANTRIENGTRRCRVCDKSRPRRHPY